MYPFFTFIHKFQSLFFDGLLLDRDSADRKQDEGEGNDMEQMDSSWNQTQVAQVRALPYEPLRCPTNANLY